MSGGGGRSRGRGKRPELPSTLQPSAKVDALLEFLTLLRNERPGGKSVVFSQWTRMLDVVSLFLVQRGFTFVRLDGTMMRRDRDDAVLKFQTDPRVLVFLVSLRCGGVGLNLTAAQYVFCLDPWFNPGVEDQAIDRIHRLGQKEDVHVWRFITKDTVEGRILRLQEHKRKLTSRTLAVQPREGFLRLLM